MINLKGEWKEHNIIIMQAFKSKEKGPSIKLTTSTWYKDSHSLYDYESTKITETKMEFSLNTKWLNIYRKKNSSEIEVIDSKSKSSHKLEDFEFIAHCQIEPLKPFGVKFSIISPSVYKDRTKESSNEKQRTNQSVDSINEKEEDPYYIVSKNMNQNNFQTGYKLVPGMTIKLGRIEYFVTEYFDGSKKISKPMPRARSYFNENVLKCESIPSQAKNPCKICLDETDEGDNFLFNPCKCNGSCGTVHYSCLAEWIRIKVKKDVVGGTQHYNFTKFECEVCKSELPGFIEMKNQDGKVYNKELITLDRPQGTYLIFQGACEKEKSIMIMQNTPQAGIKLGRGHQCEIRITDISVSRKHAYIKSQNNEFYILDNNSKFGTLVREQNMSFQVRKEYERKCIQIGRTLLDFQVIK